MAMNMSCFLLTCFLSLLASLLFSVLKRRSRRIRKRLPPGDMGTIPWIGETMEFYKAQQKNQLFESFVQPRTAKYGKIFKTRLLGSPTVVVNGAEANRFFLTNEFKLVISSWPSSSVELMGKNSIMAKQGEAHRRLRGVIANSLGCAGLETMVPKICDAVQSHLDRYWHGKDEVSLYRMTKVLTFTIVCESLLGIEGEPETLAMFERVLEGVFAPPIKYPGSKFSRAKKAREEIENVFRDVVRQKKKKQEEMHGKPESGEEKTLLSRLVDGLIRGEMSEEEVVDNVILLVFAAQDTTSSAIAMMFRMLAQHPDCYTLLLQGN